MTEIQAAEVQQVQHEERVAYVVIDDRWGAQFSSESLDAAVTFVSEKLREQARGKTLLNPSNYRIQQVKAG